MIERGRETKAGETGDEEGSSATSDNKSSGSIWEMQTATKIDRDPTWEVQKATNSRWLPRPTQLPTHTQ